jgi:hypothetical protein
VRSTRVRRAISVAALAFAASASVAGERVARAADPPAATDTGTAAPGAAALKRARAAWDRGALRTAEPLYKEALEKGGLAPNEVLEGYVRLGSIRASLGKKEQAVAAFRAASILDANFKVPPQAGRRGPGLAERAKHDTAKIGSIQLSITAPKDAAPGKGFVVTATLDKPHVMAVSKIGLVARDPSSGKETSVETKPDEQVDLEVPADVVAADATLAVRVDALDARANRLASAEARVQVGPAAAKEPAAVAAATPAASSGGRSPAATGAFAATPSQPGADVRKGGGFWSTAWPYVIGSVVLAGAGAAVYFGTRPPDEVSVGEIGVRTR